MSNKVAEQAAALAGRAFVDLDDGTNAIRIALEKRLVCPTCERPAIDPLKWCDNLVLDENELLRGLLSQALKAACHAYDCDGDAFIDRQCNCWVSRAQKLLENHNGS